MPGIRRRQDVLGELKLLADEKRRRKDALEPTHYGLPDLCSAYLNLKDIDAIRSAGFSGPTELRRRQEGLIRDICENYLRINRDGKDIAIKIIPQQLKFITDVFYGYNPFAILWKSRGGGGSLSASIIIWLLMVYLKKSALNIATAGKQALEVYKYVAGYWEMFPSMAAALLTKEPLQSRTELATGVTLECVNASHASVRGKHLPVLIIDECCTENKEAETVMEAAVQITMSEKDPRVIILSTFHLSTGLFADYWDMAQEKGFAKYTWSIADTLEKCDIGLEQATPNDPLALNYCRLICPITRRRPIRDAHGKIVDEEFIGCNGVARNGEGFLPVNTAIVAERLNRGTDIFDVEFLNIRPITGGSTYNSDLIDQSKRDDLPDLSPSCQFAVGVDWGFSSQCAIVLTCKDQGEMWVLDAVFMSHQLTSAVIGIIQEWMLQYGRDDMEIYADAASPHQNAELSEAGFNVASVAFNTWGDKMREDVKKWLASGKFRIYSGLTPLISQLKKYKAPEKGQRKRQANSHGPDALSCAILRYMFEPEIEIPESTSNSQGNKHDVALPNKAPKYSKDGDVIIF